MFPVGVGLPSEASNGFGKTLWSVKGGRYDANEHSAMLDNHDLSKRGVAYKKSTLKDRESKNEFFVYRLINGGFDAFRLIVKLTAFYKAR